ncbi:MAG: hypothetical protein KatS3mg130_1063 [Candidatus Sumerlaea sp.]|nr:MAG: hypothetical protein KatS3mg130_1063 [Candidatus Sumerlaea sp.]
MAKSYTFHVAYNNSHTGPVAAGTSAANPTGAGAATGLEIAIPVTLLGPGPYDLLVGISGASGYWSNQFLPPASPTGNLGGGARTFKQKGSPRSDIISL